MEDKDFEIETKKILSRLKELELQQKLNTQLLKEVCDKTKTIQAGFKKLAKTFAEMAEAFK